MEFILLALRLAPTIVSAGEDIAEFVEWAIAVRDAGGPTDADWGRLHAKEAQLRAALVP